MTTGAALALLEREAELDQLVEALDAARDGAGSVVVIEAEAGLGKTSLLRAGLGAGAEGGFTCLRARATELERAFAYGCVRQLLEPIVARMAKGERERLFAGAAAHSVSLFDPGHPAAPPAADSAFSILHGLYWLINNLAEDDPVLLVIDDLHWADLESLRLLEYLAPRLDGLAVLVIASARTAEASATELARLVAAPETAAIRLQPLSRAAIASLCERRLERVVEGELVDACLEVTGGNPFFCEALLAEVAARGPAENLDGAGVRLLGPAAVAQAVLLRLAGKPPGATAVVRAVAVLGDGTGVAEAAELAGLAEEDATAAADLLASLGILEAGGTLGFAHPIVREAVYGDIGAGERAQAHARAAEVLAAGGASDERIAAQLLETEPAGRADRADLLRRVADDALARGASGAAVVTLRRALAEPPPDESRTELLLQLGVAELRLGAPEAVEHLTTATEAIREPARLTAASRQLANALTVSGDSDRAVEVLAAAIERVEAEDRGRALLLEAELASHALQASPEVADPARERLERRGGLGGETAPERLVAASVAFQRARASESAAAAAELLEGVLTEGLLDEQEQDIVGPFYDVVVGLLATDTLDLVADRIDVALADARARASIPATAYLTGRRGWVALRRGEVERAEDDARTALTLLTDHRIALGVPFATSLLVEALVERGELEKARSALDAVADDVKPGPTNNFLWRARGRLLIESGRAEEGLEALREFGRLDELWGAANPLASRWRSDAARALLVLGDDAAAREMATEDLERARSWGAASGVGVALRALALCEDTATSVKRLREAVETLGRSPARLEESRVLVDLGAALRRANQRREARAALERGVDLAGRLGARALAERGRTEVRAAGGRTSDPYGTGVEQLTASELRVAELAAQGRSNPEIAQALFVTRKTVETHLGNVYRKLDIAGRGELPTALRKRAPDER